MLLYLLFYAMFNPIFDTYEVISNSRIGFVGGQVIPTSTWLYMVSFTQPCAGNCEALVLEHSILSPMC